MFESSASITARDTSLAKRWNCYYNNYSSNNCDWYIWGRFVILGVVIVIILIAFVICACVTARRRRARGAQPYYGTGWMAANHGPVNYYGNNPAQPAAPGYNAGYNNQAGFGGAPPQYGYGYETNNGYYGNRGQETGVELQSPPTAYPQPSDNAYQPPAGPPPGKGDIIR